MSELSYTSTRSSSRSQTSTVYIPSGAKIKSVKVNTGSVSWSKSGNAMTLNFSNGNSVGSSTYSYDCTASPASKVATGTYNTTDKDIYEYDYPGYPNQWYEIFVGDDPSPPQTLDYNDGSYSGTLGRQSCTSGATTTHPFPSNPTSGEQWTYRTVPDQWNYSGTVTAIPKTCTGTTYYYQYVATIVYEVGRFSRFVNVDHYGRGKGGVWEI